MKKINPHSSNNQATLRKLAGQLSNQDERPTSRNLAFYWKIEQQFLAGNNILGGGISNSFAARIER